MRYLFLLLSFGITLSSLQADVGDARRAVYTVGYPFLSAIGWPVGLDQTFNLQVALESLSSAYQPAELTAREVALYKEFIVLLECYVEAEPEMRDLIVTGITFYPTTILGFAELARRRVDGGNLVYDTLDSLFKVALRLCAAGNYSRISFDSDYGILISDPVK